MIGLVFNFQEIILIVAWLNLAGAFAAITIGGLGVAETALAAILIFMGFEPEQAVPVSLIVRPAALANVIICCGLVEWYCRTGILGRLAPNGQADER